MVSRDKASLIRGAQDVGNVMNVTVGHATNVVTLPATAAGLQFVIRCGTSGERIAVSPEAADKIMGADLGGVDDKDRMIWLTHARPRLISVAPFPTMTTSVPFLFSQRGFCDHEETNHVERSVVVGGVDGGRASGWGGDVQLMDGLLSRRKMDNYGRWC
jgi:hypothetical protein